MKDGYLITLDDGTQVETLPNNDEKLALDIDNVSVSIVGGNVTISGTSETIRSAVPQRISEPDKDTMTKQPITKTKEPSGIRKKCIECKGKRYCITNGCANTPCGWICD